MEPLLEVLTYVNYILKENCFLLHKFIAITDVEVSVLLVE